VWLVSGEIKLHEEVIDERRFIKSYTCDYSQQLLTYLSMEIPIIELVCFVLIYFLGRTWKDNVITVPALKWIMLTTNNLILAFIFIIPLTITIQNDDDVCSIYSTTILLTTTGTVLALVLPQFLLSQIPFCCCKKNNADNSKLIEKDRPTYGSTT